MGQPTDSTLTLLDTLQAQFAMFANVRNVENVWLQHNEGVVDVGVLQTYAQPKYAAKLSKPESSRGGSPLLS